MVNRLLKLLRKEYGSMHQAALLLGFFSLASQLLGLVRDRALVSFLGPSLSLDVYYAAFRIPDFIYTSLASLVAVTAVIPFLVERLEAGGHEEARRFMDRIFTVFLGAMCVLCIILVIIMPLIADVVAPGFPPEGKRLLVIMSRIMLFSPIFLGLQNLLGSVVQMHKKFFVYALAPVMYNLGIVFGVFILYPIFGLYGLAYGVVLGALLHLGIQLPAVYELGFWPRFTSKINWKEIKTIVAIALPRTLTLAMNTILTLVLTSIASNLASGSISMMTFAFNLQTVPIQMISVSYAIAAFPSLVEKYAAGKMEEFIGLIRSASQQIIFWSLPITAAFIVLRAHIVRIVYGTHSLSWNDTRVTAAMFAVLAFGIVAQSLTLVFIRAYYASGKTAKPFILTLIGAVVTCVAAVFLTQTGTGTSTASFTRELLRLTGVTNVAIIGLGIAYVIGQFTNLALFWIFFKIDFKGHMLRTLTKTIWTSVLGAVVLGITSYGMLGVLSTPISSNTFTGVLLQTFIAGGTGIICACVMLYLCSSEELMIFWNAIHSRFWKAQVLSPGQEGFE
jgi:putative peptidoglycan lipid II flippase